jgi:methionyl-tRNA synthetase
LKTKLDGRYGRLPEDSSAHIELVRAKVAEARAAYRDVDLAGAVRAALEIADRGNKLFQEAEPWRKVNEDKPATRDLITLCLNIARAAWVLVAPVVPSLAQGVYGMLGLEGSPASFDEALAFDLIDRPCGNPGRIIDRADKKQLEAVIDASKPKGSPPPAPPPEKPVKAAKAPPAEAPPPAEISIDDFKKIDLRVGLVVAAETVEGADKLLRLSIDLGEPKPRNVFAGIRSAYEPADLLGKRVVVVANLAPRKMRFGISEGMVLAAGPGGNEVWVLSTSDSVPPGTKVS